MFSTRKSRLSNLHWNVNDFTMSALNKSVNFFLEIHQERKYMNTWDYQISKLKDVCRIFIKITHYQNACKIAVRV